MYICIPVSERVDPYEGGERFRWVTSRTRCPLETIPLNPKAFHRRILSVAGAQVVPLLFREILYDFAIPFVSSGVIQGPHECVPADNAPVLTAFVSGL